MKFSYYLLVSDFGCNLLVFYMDAMGNFKIHMACLKLFISFFFFIHSSLYY